MTKKTTEDSSQKGTGDKTPPSGLLLGGSILAVILVMGVVMSLWIFFRGGDEPLADTRSTSDVNSPLDAAEKFEQYPFFDESGRVVYTPLDPAGVALAQVRPATDRPESDAPGGIMLQLVNGNMVLPFSATDGPADFSENGIATGFSRTAQGATLAAVHYAGYVSSGNNRLAQLNEAGLIEDPHGLVSEQLKTKGGVPDNFPYRLFPYLAVEYNPDLSKVMIGYTATMDSGEVLNRVSWFDLVWKTDKGWVLALLTDEGFGGGTVSAFTEEWFSWW